MNPDSSIHEILETAIDYANKGDLKAARAVLAYALGKVDVLSVYVSMYKTQTSNKVAQSGYIPRDDVHNGFHHILKQLRGDDD